MDWLNGIESVQYRLNGNKGASVSRPPTRASAKHEQHMNEVVDGCRYRAAGSEMTSNDNAKRERVLLARGIVVSITL